MGLLRRRNDLGGTRYRLRVCLVSIGDDFWIETENQGTLTHEAFEAKQKQVLGL